MLKEDILLSIEEGKKIPDHSDEIRQERFKNPRSIVVLDDDPTGTQTVYDIPVITEWTEQAIEKELVKSPVFFILTNSRSLQTDEADDLGKLIGERLQNISKKLSKKIVVISRSDSTLRGHYSSEVDALIEGLEWRGVKHVLVPAFFEGGRYTYNDIHLVKEGDTFLPAAKTPFAQDNTFGYKTSNLKDWIIEKTAGKVNRSGIGSLSVDTIRNRSAEKIRTLIAQPKLSHIVVNATSYADLQKVALACLGYNGNLIFRTAASFINAITGIALKPCLTKNDILKKERNSGGLVIIGSYVAKTTKQLHFLQKKSNSVFVEIDVSNVLNPIVFKKEIKVVTKDINQYLESGKDVVVYTSREVIKGSTKEESLNIVNLVSSGLILMVNQLTVQPHYILAKGGITSSDIATKGLSVQRAMILGQVIKGVPVWKLGVEAKFPNMPYIVFPGNVGAVDALYKVVNLLE